MIGRHFCETQLFRSPARLLRIALACGVIGAGASSAALAQEPDSLTESYRDWTVRCATPDGGERRCWMVQSLHQKESGERVLQLEIVINDGTAHLAVLAPFGLLLSEGVTLTVDDGEHRQFAFQTCLPKGCLVEAKPSINDLSAWRRGRTLGIDLVAAQNETPFKLEMSLAGFSAAYDRLAVLAES